MLGFNPFPLSPGEKALCAHWIEALVEPGANLEATEKKKFLSLLGTEVQPTCL
jgi:hypothetical protein